MADCHITWHWVITGGLTELIFLNNDFFRLSAQGWLFLEVNIVWYKPPWEQGGYPHTWKSVRQQEQESCSRLTSFLYSPGTWLAFSPQGKNMCRHRADWGVRNIFSSVLSLLLYFFAGLLSFYSQLEHNNSQVVESISTTAEHVTWIELLKCHDGKFFNLL